MSWLCAGCRSTFSREAHLLQHFQKGSRRACQNAHQDYLSTTRRPFRHRRPARIKTSTPQAGPSDSGPNRSLNHSPEPPVPSAAAAPSPTGEDLDDDEPPPVPFAGDFFGTADDYTDEDFPFGEEGDQVAVAELARHAPAVHVEEDTGDNDAEDPDEVEDEVEDDEEGEISEPVDVAEGFDPLLEQVHLQPGVVPEVDAGDPVAVNPSPGIASSGGQEPAPAPNSESERSHMNDNAHLHVPPRVVYTNNCNRGFWRAVAKASARSRPVTCKMQTKVGFEHEVARSMEGR
ncbi:hypothetical protein FKP32DRAFT_1602236 [Trametes sanguinea]|nr:hypothetical protein FKP32DRAFT_1602236 [Trametes sanguinea]